MRLYLHATDIVLESSVIHVLVCRTSIGSNKKKVLTCKSVLSAASNSKQLVLSLRSNSKNVYSQQQTTQKSVLWIASSSKGYCATDMNGIYTLNKQLRHRPSAISIWKKWLPKNASTHTQVINELTKYNLHLLFLKTDTIFTLQTYNMYWYVLCTKQTNKQKWRLQNK